MIAYSYAGDIYVGDPTTGETTAVVTHTEYETNPFFSPDAHESPSFAAIRKRGESTIVVVRADGSDERVLLPEGREHQGFGSLAWTPDSEYVVVELDGELSLFDSSGTGDERLLTPPLPPNVGGHYFNASIHVAPMFRPPVGDRILAGDRNTLSVFDAHLAAAIRLGSDALEPYEPYVPFRLTWSPDGTRFAFGLSRLIEEAGTVLTEPGGMFVMSAEGQQLRRIRDDADSFWQWSPDGSRIAFERPRPKADRAVIVLVDPDTGEEHALESTSAARKEAGARFSTVTYNNVVHHWYYEGWMWHPMGAASSSSMTAELVRGWSTSGRTQSPSCRGSLTRCRVGSASPPTARSGQPTRLELLDPSSSRARARRLADIGRGCVRSRRHQTTNRRIDRRCM